MSGMPPVCWKQEGVSVSAHAAMKNLFTGLGSLDGGEAVWLLYANHKKLPLDDVTVTISHDRQYVDDCMGCDDAPRKIEVINRTVTLVGNVQR